MVEALSSSETSVLTRVAWRNIQEDSILHDAGDLKNCNVSSKRKIYIELRSMKRSLGRRRCRWEVNIEMYLRDVGGCMLSESSYSRVGR
jgi:hypothetical protein